MTVLVAAATTRGRSTALLGVALLGAGIGWRYPVLAGVGGCLLMLVVAEVIAVVRAGDLAVDREVAPRVVVRHGDCTGTLRIGGRRRRGLVRVDASDLVDGLPVAVRLPETSAAREGTTVTYPIPTPRRGILPVGPVRLRRYGLAGMAARTADAGAVDEVRVLPRQIPLAAMMPGHRRAAAGGDDSLEQGGTDLVGLHEYTRGDDLRRLHWATSARTGTLMVREDAEPAEPHLCVVLDDRLGSYGDLGPGAPDRSEEFEEAVELVAALCRTGVDRGHPLRFRTLTGRTEIVVPGSATHQPRREAQDLQWLLAEIQPVGAPGGPDLGTRDLDIVVVVTGSAADLREVGLVLGEAPTRLVAVVDPSATVAAEQQAGATVLRAATSVGLAALWDAAAADAAVTR